MRGPVLVEATGDKPEPHAERRARGKPGRPKKTRALDELVAMTSVPPKEGKRALVRLHFHQYQRKHGGATPTVADMAEVFGYGPKNFKRDAGDEHELVLGLIDAAKRLAAQESSCIEVRERPSRRAN